MPGGIMGGYHEPGFPLYFVNNRMLEYLGYTYDEFVKATDGLVLHCIHPKDRAHVEQTVSAQLAEGDSYTVTYRMLKKDGSFLWVHDKGRLITTEAGRQAIISVCLDITDQVEAKNELSFIAQSRLGGIFTARMDEGFTLLYANPFYYQLHGYTEQEFTTKPLFLSIRMISRRSPRRLNAPFLSEKRRSLSNIGCVAERARSHGSTPAPDSPRQTTVWFSAEW